MKLILCIGGICKKIIYISISIVRKRIKIESYWEDTNLKKILMTLIFLFTTLLLTSPIEAASVKTLIGTVNLQGYDTQTINVSYPSIDAVSTEYITASIVTNESYNVTCGLFFTN